MRSVGSSFLSVEALVPGNGLRFPAVVCIGMVWLSGCSSLATARSSTLSDIANAASPYHPAYVQYRQGRLTEAQLTDRLPHIAMIGDSLSRDFFVSSVFGMLWRAKMHHRRDWFLDTDASPDSVYSVYERLARETPLVACEYSSAGGEVDSGGGNRGLLGPWLPLDLSQQTDLVLEEKRFPDLVLLWIGHNNLDWVDSVDPHLRENADLDAVWQKMAADFRKDYERQLRRLVERARQDERRRALIVFGLFNLKSFFEARDAAERLREKDPRRFPSFDVCYQRFESMKPEYRAHMVRLALMMNEALRAMVAEFNRELGGDAKVRLEYSDALATLDIGNVALIHPMDAWHPSAKGHSVLAEAAFGTLGPSLEFLGIVANRKNGDCR